VRPTFRCAAVIAALVLAATGCSGGKDDDAKTSDQPAALSSVPPDAPSSSAPTASSTKAVMSHLNQLSTSGAVAALKGTGFTCGIDVAYAICKSGTVEVWLLLGDHKRFPVVSLHSNGPVGASRSAIGAQLTKVLRTVHVNEVNQVDEWYQRQEGVPTAQETIGDWKVALSAEEGSDSPGVHLTLNDKRCKQKCQAE
jgi:hypothetical protein